MPTVKVWSPQVDTQALPTPSGAPGGGVDVLTQGIRDVGNTISKVWEQDQLDRVTQAETAFQRELNDSIDRVQSAKGLDSVVAAGEAANAVAKSREELAKGFQSPAAQKLFMARSAALEEAARRQSQAYVRQQREEVTSQTLVARRQVGLNAIARSAFDDEAFATQLHALESFVNADEAAKGRPHVEGATDDQVNDITRARREEVRQAAVMTRLNTLIGSESTGGLDKARQVLEVNRDLLGDKVGEYTGRIRAQVFAVDGSARGREIANGAKATVTLPWDPQNTPIVRLDPNAAQAALTKLEADPTVPEPVKRIAREEVEHQVRTATAYFDRTLDDVYDRALTKVQASGWRLSAAGEEKAFLLDPKVNGGKQWAAIEAKAKAKLHENEPATPAQKAAFVDFLVTFPERQAEYIKNPRVIQTEWAAKLHAGDLDRAAAHVSQVGVAAQRPDETLPAWTLKAINVEGGPDRGSLWSAKGPKTPDQVASYNLIVQDLLAEQAKAKLQGKPLTEQVVKDRLTYWTTRGTVKDTGVLSDDSGVPRAKAATATTYEGKAFVEEIPKKHLDALKKANLEKGLPTNDAWIRWTYNNALGIPDDQNPVPPKPPPPPAPLRGLSGLSD